MKKKEEKKPEGTGGKDLFATAANAPASIPTNLPEDAPANSVAGGHVAGIQPGEVVVRKRPKPTTPEDFTNPQSTGRKLLHFKDFLKQK